MALPDLLLALLWVSMTVYALLGGADFGGGVLDLAARGRHASRQRTAIAASMGAVWEANHVWLIYFVTGLFSAFPRAYEAVSIALYLPLLIALVGIVMRGAAFAFRGHYEGAGAPRAALGRVFGIASVVTPFFLGATAGALAGEEIRFRGGEVDAPGVVAIWTGPFPLACGFLAVAICAYLAATYLTVDMGRLGESLLREDFRRRALFAGAAAGVLSLLALAVSAADAPSLYDDLTGRALPIVAVGVVAGAGSMAAMWRRRFRLARALLAITVTAVLWAWAVGRYPELVGPDVTVTSAAAPESMQVALVVVAAVGMTILIPSLYLLYVMFRRDPPPLSE